MVQTRSREKVTIGTGDNQIIVTVKRDRGAKRHIVITVPGHMRWATVWKILKKLPKYLQNGRKK